MNPRLQPLWLAIGLLTIVPVHRLIGARVSPGDQGRSVVWYPWVGALIGGVLGIVSLVTGSAGPILQAALVLVVWIILTGGLHLDGLADCIDGAFAGHRDPARIAAVMKEPTAGPMAVIALGLVLLVKFAALAVLAPHAGQSVVGLLVVPLLARAAAAGLMATTVYRSADGIARDQAATRSRSAIAISIALALAVSAVLLAGPIAFGVFFVVAGLAVGWRGFWHRRLAGYTGDVLGGLIELVETGALVVLAWSVAVAWH